MSKETSEIEVIAQSVPKESDATVIVKSNETTHQNSAETGVSPYFFKLAKRFAIDGALLPEEQQLLIEDRTAKRARLSQLRKQQNIENIMQKTLGYCGNFDLGQRTDHDWLSRYITLSEEVSNPTMQDLWAKILAGELTKPGSFSFKALQVFRDMSIYDAKLLAKACSLAIKEPNKKGIRLISGVYQQPGLFNFFSKQRQQYCNLSQFGLNYTDVLALAENHLIYLQESESSLLSKGENIHFTFNGLPLKLTAKKRNVCLQFYKFTPLGAELAHLISDKNNEEFFAYLKEKLAYYFVIDGD
ncbi:TIGR03899 family protein [Colwellia ponticola]|uniref:TIGR03899 family protein n=1 Tax=Colwellia ponticola TaxID=2304625 RepID=A0A8H2JM25_9GAMM|nr:TIGR03899 family protein [Colwellia ponticola]TMM43889.1 TIGR03899 family protein [Colwellia ponticola]